MRLLVMQSDPVYSCYWRRRDGVRMHPLNIRDDLLELRELYRKDWPKNFLGYQTLNNFVKWLEKEPQLKHTHIYSLNANWREHGLFVIVERYQVFLNSLKPGDEDLGRALKLLDWTRGYKITSLHKSHYNTVVSALNELGVNWRSARLVIYRMAMHRALVWNVSCPAGLEVRPLSIVDAKLVNDLWPSRQAGSLCFTQRLIRFNISMGVYDRDSQELLAWCTRCQCGFLGTLHVIDSHRRRGLATLVVHWFARQVALAGDDVYVLVHELNQASNELFQSLGFDLMDQAYHLRAYNVSEELLWPNEE